MLNRIVISALILMALASAAAAQEGTALEQPFQIALWTPVAARPDNVGITIFRLNVIYGRNLYVKGLDLGLANHCTGGVSKSWQIGLVNFVEGDFIGWQDACLVNYTSGGFTGYQSGFYNEVADGEGVQLGLINRAGHMSGLQLGFVNWCESMYGLQIGFANYIASKETLPFFVFVNWSF
jgi:hypothetical protein